MLDLQANTIATAEAAEANLRTFMENDDEKAARNQVGAR